MDKNILETVIQRQLGLLSIAPELQSKLWEELGLGCKVSGKK